jgi:hypothetical protein
MRYIMVEAEVSLSEILPDIPTDELIKELRSRNAPCVITDTEEGLQSLREAIRDCRMIDALALFDLLTMPRNKDKNSCRRQYQLALEARQQ